MSEDSERNIIELVGEDGETVSLEHLDTVEYKNETYMAFISAEESPDDTYELTILKLEQDDQGEQELVTIDDEDLEDELFQIFSERLDEALEDEEE